MRILYVASSAYPGDSAYSTRIDGLCKAFQLVGVQTDVLTDYSNIDNRTFKYHGRSIFLI